jgi:integrase/recombinase XerD
MTPVITIFVRHSPGCKYEGEEFAKQCRCRKHLRWSLGGKQHRRKAGTRSWAEAEEQKRRIEDELSGRPAVRPEGMMLATAIDTFLANKEAQGIKSRVLSMYRRELKRLREFCEVKSIFTADRALTIENLIALRVTWTNYKSSYSRSTVQKHLNHFLKFCYNAGWIERIPGLSAIKIDAPETEPLTKAEYTKLLRHATGKTRVIIQVMRWSGLAVRDASTLKRSDMIVDGKGMYKIIRDRVKTGTPLYIPIPTEVAKEILAVMNGSPVYVFWNRQTADSSEYRQAGYMGEAIAEAFKSAGIHSAGHMISPRLRSTFAVDLLQKGVPLEHVSKLLGHKSVTTTERHYAKWVKGRQDRLDTIVAESWTKK